MGQTTKGIVYPSDPTAQADLITDLETMAESTDTAIGNVQIPVDSTLSSTSENPVQNKVIYTALQGKEDTLTFDITPTTSSTNPVTSGGIKTYVDTIVGDIETILTTLDVGSGV